MSANLDNKSKPKDESEVPLFSNPECAMCSVFYVFL